MPTEDAWRRIASAIEEAEAVVSGRRGPYPLDDAQKTEMLARLRDVRAEVAGLVREGRLQPADAALFELEMVPLVSSVAALRPPPKPPPPGSIPQPPRPPPTCYAPLPWDWQARQSVARLRERLPLLEQVAQSGTVRLEVVAKALIAIERDVELLRSEQGTARIAEAERAQAEQVRDQAARLLDRVLGRPTPPSATPGLLDRLRGLLGMGK